MRHLLRLLAPRYRAASVTHMTPERLRAWQIDALMLDLDSTLVPWGGTSPPPAVAEWIAELRRQGIPACVVSNSLSGRVRTVAAALGLPVAEGRFKPSAAKLRHALRVLATSPARTAMVGDQLFTDVLAGNRLGVPTILVVPLSPREPWRIRLMRRLEQRILAALAAQGLAPPAP
ncbi:MAG: YqeG family HAD IIIA-type phosphatase [Armatimonadota bacterium]|nr:YqeG family HAD IIIA-type phosphatase [Armatimonadota bacterium]MDR7550368.1 YqeG family HAD IIIA-type phosphatase [Armatimonadota bacterium]